MSIEAMKQALEALAASDDFLFNYHDCEPNNEREMDAYSEIRANNHEAFMALRTAIEQAEKRWSEFNETTKRNIEHADWYLSTHSAPEPVGVVKVLPLGDGHKPMHWADWTDDDNHPPEGTLLYTTPPAAPVQEPPDDGFTQALIERDEYHAIADELAEMIARITGEDIGEHTSANFPRRNALDAAENWLCNPPAAQPAPVQEPVAYVVTTEVHGQMCSFIHRIDLTKLLPDGAKLYTTPPAQEFVCSTGLCHYKEQRSWVGLSEEEIDKLKHLIDWTATWSHGRFAYEIEQLLKEKNA